LALRTEVVRSERRFGESGKGSGNVKPRNDYKMIGKLTFLALLVAAFVASTAMAGTTDSTQGNTSPTGTTNDGAGAAQSTADLSGQQTTAPSTANSILASTWLVLLSALTLIQLYATA